MGEAMSSPAGRAVQLYLVLAGLAGAILLGSARRWEVIPLTIPIIVVSVIAVLTLAPPRRNEVLMTLVLVLGAIAFSAVRRWLADPGAGLLPARTRPGGGSAS